MTVVWVGPSSINNTWDWVKMVAQMIFWLGFGGAAYTVYSKSDLVGPNCLRARPCKMVKFWPMQTSTMQSGRR